MILRLDIRGFLKNDDEESNDVKKKLDVDRPHGTRVFQGFPRFQPSERHRDRVAAPRSGCYGAGAVRGAAKNGQVGAPPSEPFGE